ncbi:hypothetical protein G6011_01115 [Alternaria panax]|uniref:Uncharacterized protein n=1 Tax=Alternaria panax TaxID=48097 RepID=A0AAD4IKI2_9PLEO|nr:hypothetical protein G6011_01115 [Alternaria panax]
MLLSSPKSSTSYTEPHKLSWLANNESSPLGGPLVIQTPRRTASSSGVFDSDEHLAFFLQAFHDMDTEIPDMEQLTRILAESHMKSAERCEELTKDGRLVSTQDNTWTRTWEDYFTQDVRQMLQHDEKEDGERPQETEELLEPLFSKVVSRDASYPAVFLGERKC